MRTIFHNCRVLTMNPSMPEATAVVAEGAKIIYVGNDRLALSFAGNDSRLIDGGGGSLLPGFNDSHLHLLGLGLSMNNIDCRDVLDMPALQEKVAARVRSAPLGEAILGRGWDQNKWPAATYPSRYDLDQVSPHHPVILFRACGHVLVCNSRALQMANIDDSIQDVEGGSFDRTPDEKLTGVLREKAMNFILSALPKSSPQVLRDALVKAAEHAVANGITTVQTHDGGGNDWEEVVQAYRDLDLPLRVNVLFNLDKDEILAYGQDMRAASSRDEQKLGVKTIKIMADGSLGARTAALREPYHDDPTNTGLYYYTQEAFDDLVRAAHQAGFQVAIHAIGDYTADQAITAIERAQGSDTARRHRLIHCQILRRDLVARMAQANIVAEIQPIFVTTDLHWTEHRIGPERLPYAYAWKSLLEFGVQCAGGSDCPVEGISPLAGIAAAVTRSDSNGFPREGWLPEQKLSIREAIALFSIGSAYAEHMEWCKGQIRPHYLADLVLLGEDIEAVKPLDIRGVKVKLTMIAGSIAYEQS